MIVGIGFDLVAIARIEALVARHGDRAQDRLFTEGERGSPLSDRLQAIGQQVGVALLVMLMGVALFNDFARQFG